MQDSYPHSEESAIGLSASNADAMASDLSVQGGQVIDHADRIFPAFDFSFFWSHIFWLLLSFGFLYYFISRVIVPRIGDIIESRQGRIASDFDHAMRLKKEADDLVMLYEKELSEARIHATQLAEETARRVKEKFEKDRKKNENALARRLSEAEARIQSHIEKAMENFDNLVIETTQDIVIKLLGEAVPEDKIRKVLKERSILEKH